ncbi:zf-HC2 domain-containing protein [Kribbella jejuensis]|uniref:Putative zinc finger protein n=1 Tax=Kribbella jejuensis TaxID=236068 RepID=A0A542EWL8_9ACTN|nr:zf-HC2 domain-containing protein [Kribbella jejuensis]TQJ19753.1 putative zinc finger protein [Kribbella jejuensis]
MSDPYREWDAAYLLGALSAKDRRAYEEHLHTCAECSAAVASLAGVPGMLAALPADRAQATVTTEPPNLLAGLARRVQRDRRRRRIRFGAFASAGAVAAAVVGALVIVPLTRDDDSKGDYVVLSQTVSSKLSADARLVPEPWGTTIEISCKYDELATPSERSRGYELYVTDKTGKVQLIASWTSAPGTTVKPAATTKLKRDEIRALDIRSSETGRVLLAVRF